MRAVTAVAPPATRTQRAEEDEKEEEEEEEGYPMGTPCSLAHETMGQEEEASPCSLAHETMRQLRDEEEEGCPCSPAHEISAWRLAQQGPRQESQGLS